jgi:hypothetical protein
MADRPAAGPEYNRRRTQAHPSWSGGYFLQVCVERAVPPAGSVCAEAARRYRVKRGCVVLKSLLGVVAHWNEMEAVDNGHLPRIERVARAASGLSPVGPSAGRPPAGWLVGY